MAKSHVYLGKHVVQFVISDRLISESFSITQHCSIFSYNIETLEIEALKSYHIQ